MILKGAEREWKLDPVSAELIRDISVGLGVSDLLARVVASRGADSVAGAREFLAAGEADLADARLLPDSAKAVERVAQALERGEKIAVHGHDDADGVCATTIMVEALHQMGASPLTYVPDRRREGHGLSAGEIDRLAASSVGLIITVDSCVSERELIAYAGTLGIDTIVTDHHEIPPELPNAVAVVNPKLPDSPFPYRYMAGVGVSLRVAELLLAELGDRFRGRDGAPWTGPGWQDEAVALAAVGSVADKVPLSGENRKIVARGLEALPRTERPGLRAMLEESRLWGDSIEPADIQEYLGPIFGRVSDGAGGNDALRALMTRDPAEARAIAKALVAERARWRGAAADAWRGVAGQAADASRKGVAVLMVEADIPIEVMGYVTTRLADSSGRPTIVLTSKGDEVMAEARGPYGFDLVAAFRSMPGLFLGYGGHPRAAGFSARPSDVPEFKRRMLDYVALNPPQPPPRQIDAAAELLDLTTDKAVELEKLEPFGFGNSRAVLLARAVTTRVAEEAAAKGVHFGTPARLGRSPRDIVYRVRPSDRVVLVNVVDTVTEAVGTARTGVDAPEIP